MRVAVLTQYFPTSEQPWAGHSAYQTLRWLARECDVHVFYPESVYPTFLHPRSRIHGALDRTWQPDGVAASYHPYAVLPFFSRPLNGYAMARVLRAPVEAWRPDILLSYVIYPDGFAATRLARRLHIPVVLTAIGSDLNRIDRMSRRHTLDALRQADLITTVSSDLEATAVRLGADRARTHTILNGCDTSIFHPADRHQARAALQLAADAEIVLYVGRLDIRKGLVELIDAVAALRGRHPRLQCHIVGDGGDRRVLLAAAARHGGGEGWLWFHASCDTQGVARWMASADLVTLPSYKEGCPNVVLEALASGRPVVATNVGGIPELMDDSSGRLVPPRDVPALTTALETVMAHRWDSSALSSRRSRSWKAVSNELLDLLCRTRKSA